jgi:hypothetical protein
MGTVWSIRSTNGGGKTTLARRFLPSPLTGSARGGPVDLAPYYAPTKKDPQRRLRVTGYVKETAMGRVGVVGPYSAACGGLDQVPDFATSRASIDMLLDHELMRCQHVVAEGLLASGVFGSWGVYAQELRARGHAYAWCYLMTPYEVCVERIKARQAAAAAAEPNKKRNPINWSLVRGKHEQVLSNRLRALAAGETVYDLPLGLETEAMIAMMNGGGEEFRVRA